MKLKARFVLPLLAAALVIAGCSAGTVRKNIEKTDQAIAALDTQKANADAVVAGVEPVLSILPEDQKAKALEALKQAKDFLALYPSTREAYVKTRDELTEKLKDAKDEDDATWASISTIAANAVTAIFSPGGLLTAGVGLITGIAGLIKGRKNGEKDAKTIVNAVDALRSRAPAVAEAMKANKDIFVTTLSPKAWDLVESERTT